MKIKILLLWTFVMLLSISINAQSLSPRVISSAGGFFAGGSATLSVTVAEMTMVQTFVQPANILTQGFQQPEQFTTAIEENDNIAGEVSIFPNPTNSNINISFNAAFGGLCEIKLYNMVSQVVYTESFDAISGGNTIRLDLSSFRQGVYMLQMKYTDANGKKNISVHKINLVY